MAFRVLIDFWYLNFSEILATVLHFGEALFCQFSERCLPPANPPGRKTVPQAPYSRSTPNFIFTKYQNSEELPRATFGVMCARVAPAAPAAPARAAIASENPVPQPRFSLYKSRVSFLWGANSRKKPRVTFLGLCLRLCALGFRV